MLWFCENELTGTRSDKIQFFCFHSSLDLRKVQVFFCHCWPTFQWLEVCMAVFMFSLPRVLQMLKSICDAALLIMGDMEVHNGLL